MKNKGKLIVFTAPSGAGKTTIVKHLLKVDPRLSFSVSATTRDRRGGETHAVDYYFMTVKEFEKEIGRDGFVEWEEVYPGQYYGTLKSEIVRIWNRGLHILFDIDVRGALNIKRRFGKDCLTVFVKPPSLEIHLNRLKSRNTESEESLHNRIKKIQKEMDYEAFFDQTLINDVLELALANAEEIVADFIASF